MYLMKVYEKKKKKVCLYMQISISNFCYVAEGKTS